MCVQIWRRDIVQLFSDPQMVVDKVSVRISVAEIEKASLRSESNDTLCQLARISVDTQRKVCAFRLSWEPVSTKYAVLATVAPWVIYTQCHCGTEPCPPGAGCRLTLASQQMHLICC